MKGTKQKKSSGYNPKETEEKWYKFWEENKYFTPKIDKSKTPFTIVIPPPNVTGSLHMGHVLNNTIQDILIRYKRMQGYSTLWLPGTDHAGIPTQMLVERELAKQGLTKFDLGRDKLVKKIWEWKEKYGNIIIEQLKKLGCSCDWSRLKFTMDENYTLAVLTTFIELYNKGYIYRGRRIINWCCKCKTAVSDIEVIYKETQSYLYYIKYPFVDNSSEYITIATTRPETMLGDTAVAVNPNDERYKNFIGREVLLPIMNKKIPIISDEYVDMSFGTGALKITPAHDAADFEIGQRHNLPSVIAIDVDGKITEVAKIYRGEDRFSARKKIVEELKKQELLLKIEDYLHSIGHHDRCNEIIEPLLSLQWFVKMKELAQPAIDVVKKGKIKFIPERFTNIYLQWMENIKDWCISRQIWWGHRIPVWYCQEIQNEKCKIKNGIIVSINIPNICPYCSSKELIQDEDVLDTWFSSALWPHATLGWPKQTDELSYFYPTSVLSTARDIIYLWVARMIITGLEFVGDIPFREVIIHPTVLNAEGRRMSKSLGTGVDPLDLMEKYGADATRLGLMLQTSKTQDLKFQETTLEVAKKFCNKIYNAAKFVKMNLEDIKSDEIHHNENLDLPDRWILSRFNSVAKDVNKNLDKYEFSEAAKILYSFVWSEFCDWYIEIAKFKLKNIEKKPSAQKILLHILKNTMKLLHPFIPFITEEIWNIFSKDRQSIMISPWYQGDENFLNNSAEEKMEKCFEIIRTIRNLKLEADLITEKDLDIFIKTTSEYYLNLIDTTKDYIKLLSRIKDIKIFSSDIIPKKMLSKTIDDIEIILPVNKE